MQNKNSWKLVGKIKEAQGLQGEVFAIIFSREFSWKSKLQTLLLSPSQDLESSPVPNPTASPTSIRTHRDSSSEQQFEVLKAKTHKNGLVFKLKGIDNRNQSESLRGQFLYVPSELFVSKKGERIFLKEIQGFQVFDAGVPVGNIIGFSSNGAQDLLLVQNPQTTFAVPFVEAFLLEIDFDKKIVWMQLPPGLME